MTTFQSIIDYIKKLNKWRDIPYSWIGRLNIVNIVKTQKFIPTLSIDTIQFQSKSQQVILWISTDSNQHDIEGQQSWRIDATQVQEFKTYYKTIVLKSLILVKEQKNRSKENVYVIRVWK